LEQHGVYHHVSDRQSPWQNARAERYGGWIKEKAAQELQSGQGVVQNEADLEEFLIGLAQQKTSGITAEVFPLCRWFLDRIPEYPMNFFLMKH